MDRELKQIESDAYRQVQQIQGDADAQAVAIYADAHNQDPGLTTASSRAAESYASTLDSDSVVVLSTEGDYFKQLTHMNR
ncbi:MAG: hypothetical protein R3C68_04635 [Myxococcota bacterium]